MPEPVDYRSPSTEQPHPRRSTSTWIILIVIWIVGIAMWGLYLMLIAIALLRFL